MSMKKIIGCAAAAVMATGLWVGPAQAAADAGTRHLKHSHVGLSVTKNAGFGWNVQSSLKVAGRPVAGRVLTIQSKHNGAWHKVRGSRIVTDATGLATYPSDPTGICVHKVNARAYNPLLRVHYAGTRRIAAGNSRHFHAPCR